MIWYTILSEIASIMHLINVQYLYDNKCLYLIVNLAYTKES